MLKVKSSFAQALAFVKQRKHPIIYSIEVALLIRILFGINTIYVQVEKDKTIWTLFPWQAAVGAFVGIGAVITFIFTHIQKDQQFDIANLNTRFKEIVDRLASADVPTRATAVIQLAEIAQERLPGKGTEHTAENYPFFARATANFANRLRLESEQSVRDEVEKACGRMAEFDKEVGSQQLLHLLIIELADANRSAFKAFLKAIAEYVSLGTTDEEEAGRINTVATFSDFLDDTKDRVMCINIMIEQTIYEDTLQQSRIIRQIKKMTGEDTNSSPTEATLLQSVELGARRLVDTRDALATACRALKSPANLLNDVNMLSTYRRPIPLDLSQTFLAGANLEKAELPGANFTEAHLEGALLVAACLQWVKFGKAKLQNASLDDAQLQKAYLGEAQLQKAYFGGAHLQGANFNSAEMQEAFFGDANLQKAMLFNAQLQGAHFMGANLQETTFFQAQLQGASFSQAQMQKANLSKTNLQKANLSQTDLQNATLEEAQLQQACLQEAQLQETNLRRVQLQETKMAGVRMSDGVGETDRRANFHRSNWKEADFQLPYGTGQDEEAMKWLTKYFGYDKQPGDKRNLEPTQVTPASDE